MIRTFLAEVKIEDTRGHPSKFKLRQKPYFARNVPLGQKILYRKRLRKVAVHSSRTSLCDGFVRTGLLQQMSLEVKKVQNGLVGRNVSFRE